MGQKESRNATLNYAIMKRGELDFRILDLNKKCAKCFDQSSLNMLFAVKSTEENNKQFIWRGNIRILCFTVLDGKVYRKSYNPLQFLKFYQSFTQILEASEASNERENLANNQNLMKMSIFDDSCCGFADDQQCVICFDARPDSVLPCAHAYCSRCVDSFRNIDQSCCPLCRHPLRTHGQDEAWVITEKPSKESINRYLVQQPAHSTACGTGQDAEGAFESDND